MVGNWNCNWWNVKRWVDDLTQQIIIIGWLVNLRPGSDGRLDRTLICRTPSTHTYPILESSSWEKEEKCLV
jgi:hypothetical protein